MTVTLINQGTARSIVKGICADSREQIILQAREIRSNIAQMFSDAQHWNDVNAPWKGPPIEPDQDGKLRRIADCIDRVLKTEAEAAANQRPETRPSTL